MGEPVADGNVQRLTHWYAGRSQNELATSLGVDRMRFHVFLQPRKPGGPKRADSEPRGAEPTVVLRHPPDGTPTSVGTCDRP